MMFGKLQPPPEGGPELSAPVAGQKDTVAALLQAVGREDCIPGPEYPPADRPPCWMLRERSGPPEKGASFYDRLITAETERLRQLLVWEIEQLKAGDRAYEVRIKERMLRDFLGTVNRHEQEEPDNETLRYILRRIRNSLLLLLLELSTRYRRQQQHWSICLQQIYTEGINRPPPAELPFFLTAGYYSEQAASLILRLEAVDSYKQLLEELAATIRRLWHGKEGDPEVYPYLDTLHHLENALLLIILQPAFIKRDGQRLAEASFAREWVVGTHKEYLNETETEAAARKLEQLGYRFAEWRRLTQTPVKIPVELSSSAARHWAEELRRLERGQLNRQIIAREGNVVYRSPGEVSDFIGYVQKKFVTIGELKEAFGVRGNRSVHKYLTKMDTEIRHIHFSDKKQLYYREDIDRALEDNTELLD